MILPSTRVYKYAVSASFDSTPGATQTSAEPPASDRNSGPIVCPLSTSDHVPFLPIFSSERRGIPCYSRPTLRDGRKGSPQVPFASL
jgi:hypothetical protein